MSLFDLLFAPVTVTGSSLGAKAKTVLGALRAFITGPNPDDAEVVKDVPLHTAIGVITRPLDPTDAGGATGLAARSDNGFFLLAGGDRRLNAARAQAGDMPKGTICIAGYGGAFVELAFDEASGHDVVTIKHRTGTVLRISVTGELTITNAGGSVVAALDGSALSVGPSPETLTKAPEMTTWCFAANAAISALITHTGTTALTPGPLPGSAATTTLKGT